MAILKGRLLIATASVLCLVSCGGGTENTDFQQTTTDEISSTTETVEQLAQEAVADAGESGWSNLQQNWQDSIGSIKDQWADLTEEELLLVNGDREQLVSLVQQKYGLDRETATMEVNNWASAL